MLGGGLVKGTALLVGDDTRIFGRALAAALGLEPQDQPLPPSGRLDVDALLQAERGAGVAMTVVSRRSLPDPASLTSLTERAGKPLVVLPADPPRTTVVSRVLAPLDGTADAAQAVAEVQRLFAPCGADVLVLQVFEPATVPAFWDQPQHAGQVWTHELLLRAGDGPGTRVETRSGEPAEVIDALARDEGVDLVALAWCQSSDPDRGPVVRSLLSSSRTPLLLLVRPS
jgi:nucleotide-binding universal stress UspA family protein